MTTKILLPVRSNVKLSIVDLGRGRFNVFGRRSRDVGESSGATRIPRSTFGGRDVAELADLIHDVDLDRDGPEDSMSSESRAGKKSVVARAKKKEGKENTTHFFHESARIRCYRG